MAIYFGFRSWFKHADVNAKQAKESGQGNVPELTPKQEKDRITALMDSLLEQFHFEQVEEAERQLAEGEG